MSLRINFEHNGVVVETWDDTQGPCQNEPRIGDWVFIPKWQHEGKVTCIRSTGHKTATIVVAKTKTKKYF